MHDCVNSHAAWPAPRRAAHGQGHARGVRTGDCVPATPQGNSAAKVGRAAAAKHALPAGTLTWAAGPSLASLLVAPPLLKRQEQQRSAHRKQLEVLWRRLAVRDKRNYMRQPAHIHALPPGTHAKVENY